MRRWREGCIVGLGLVGLPTLALSQDQAVVPPDFLSTFQAVDAAYERKDIESILRHYASNCTFIEVIPEFSLQSKDTQHKNVKSKSKAVRRQHDVAWQRQELQQLFFVTRQPLERPASLPLQTITVTSHIQQSFLNRKATELRLRVERAVHSHQGQVQGVQKEVDEETWSKGVQGWKLKRRTVTQQTGWTDFS